MTFPSTLLSPRSRQHDEQSRLRSAVGDDREAVGQIVGSQVIRNIALEMCLAQRVFRGC
jgi:hypothetical protein